MQFAGSANLLAHLEMQEIKQKATNVASPFRQNKREKSKIKNPKTVRQTIGLDVVRLSMCLPCGKMRWMHHRYSDFVLFIISTHYPLYICVVLFYKNI